MKIISHRGNLNGPNSVAENSPEAIDHCIINLRISIEVDLRVIDSRIWLGHDFPEYEVTPMWISSRREFLYIHAKNSAALSWCIGEGLHVFSHENDPYTMTSKGFVWAYPGQEPVAHNTIGVMPEPYWEELPNFYGICTDYPLNYRHLQENKLEHFYQKIQGWSDFIIPFYEHMIYTSKNGAIFVEVGSWKGRSVCYLATEIINAKKDITIYAVDTWRGSEEHVGFFKDDNEDPVYDEYMRNIEPVKDKINSIRATSIEAAQQFKDESLDMVLLDANHGFEEVMKDINAWWPKVKKGGMLAGDDYDPSYWPSVCQAVHEIFGFDDVHLFYKGTIWFKIKK